MRSLTPGSVDHYVPEDVGTILEERFWHAVEEKSTLEALPTTGRSSARPRRMRHFSATHGVVHARDVAAGTLELADVLDGRRIPARPDDRRQFVAALAVLIAYIHEVGMNDPSREGRRAHAIYAAQIPFSGATDDVLARLSDYGGPVVSRLCSVGAAGPFRVPDDVVLRELASLALAHSKSMVPATLHADLARLRSVLQQSVLVEFDEHQRSGARLNPDNKVPDALGANRRWYTDPAGDALAWLESPHPAHRALTADAVDAVRLVRVADVLRQRGSALRTAAGYEIFIDVDTGQAVVTSNGDLRISFHSGRFSSPAAAKSACEATARSSPTSPPSVTGVVRRAERNSTVVTTEPGDALMIPGELFSREWFRPYERASSRTSSPEIGC